MKYLMTGLFGLVIAAVGVLNSPWLQTLLGDVALKMSEEFPVIPLLVAVFMAMVAWVISHVPVIKWGASAFETLGAVTVLCTDKTGTLTENRMTLAAIIGDSKNNDASADGRSADDRSSDDKGVEDGSAGSSWKIGSDAVPSGQSKRILKAALFASSLEPNDPIDKAIHSLAQTQMPNSLNQLRSFNLLNTFGVTPALPAFTRIFSSTHHTAAPSVACVKGGVEAIAELCRLAPEKLSAITVQATSLADLGMHVLAVATASNLSFPGQAPASPHDIAFEYLGLIGFTDPLRSNVPASVAECRSAGIRVLMVSNDYPATAAAIGKQAGLASPVVTGNEIDTMSDAQLTQCLKTTSIFARVRPHQKLRIVKSLKASGEIVAMTGDGANDAAAIRAAHIGIVTGDHTVEAVRDASAMIMVEDDFSAIVKALRVGRSNHSKIVTDPKPEGLIQACHY